MKVYVQVIDQRTSVYQTGMIEEPVINGKEVENALEHFGVTYGTVKWHSRISTDDNSFALFGEVERTTKVVSVFAK